MTPSEILLDYQGRLTELKELQAKVDEATNRLGIGGRDYNEWASSCENRALNAIVREIKGNRNLPVTEEKLQRIPQDSGKGNYCTGYGRWLLNMTPKLLDDWIKKNIGNPTATEIQTTLDEIFPPYLRDKDHVFDDAKSTVSRHVTSLETGFSSPTYWHLGYNFKPEPYLAFLKLCHALGGNIAYEDAEVPTPAILDKEQKWYPPNIWRWHGVPQSEGVLRIRPLQGGVWRFELSGPAYVRIKELGLKNFAKKNPYE